MTEHHGRRMAAADETELRGWLTGRVPDGWFDGALSVQVDREEITVIGVLPIVPLDPDIGEVERTAAARGRTTAFREDTREQRMAIASELEQRTDRKVAWGVEIDGDRVMFTHLAAPVMTRLRQPERRVLDTLVASGVARSRADALAWCVRLVGQHTNDWLQELRDAMSEVDRVRVGGPGQ
jgi:hypothetical protein